MSNCQALEDYNRELKEMAAIPSEVVGKIDLGSKMMTNNYRHVDFSKSKVGGINNDICDDNRFKLSRDRKLRIKKLEKSVWGLRLSYPHYHDWKLKNSVITNNDYYVRARKILKMLGTDLNPKPTTQMPPVGLMSMNQRIKALNSTKINSELPSPTTTYSQMQKINKAVRKQCANYCVGECGLLDCLCPQENASTVCCSYFKEAVLTDTSNRKLMTELYPPKISTGSTKKCPICESLFKTDTNIKYCSDRCRNFAKKKNIREARIRRKSVR